ncbi:DcrB-related protein [Snodgrassella alvi]|jgi:hypothetical protein|uniref:DUF1795 domain-containing protein n=2 Tax=Snodgrassella TaxID=1193515 RepID=A0A855FKS3_9NEIS|nr:DcrB-related protein [Snodgrassella alvi]PIT11061.1 hypothetical protein BGI30_04720 [Snodgrassella alvi]PIT55238.1 hypothetical protein BHC59_11275 [Snodgrassella alvi]PIT58795.1 hypothetical protein BHC57_11085 [Snodgrassella alvi]
MHYNTNDTQFEIPSTNLQDSTLNILKFKDLGTSLVMSRSQLAEEETLESSLDSQLKRLEDSVKGLKFEQKNKISFGKNKDIEAFELSNQFIKGTEKVYQYQLVCVIPGTRTLFAMNYVKNTEFGKKELAHWQLIKQSFEFK